MVEDVKFVFLIVTFLSLQVIILKLCLGSYAKFELGKKHRPNFSRFNYKTKIV